MILRKFGWWLLLSVGLIVACGDDEHPLPSYRQDLAELRTDNSGVARQLYLDDGTAWVLENPVGSLPADTVMRIYALYEKSEHKVLLYGAQSVFSPFPEQISADSMRLDPLKVKAVWRNGYRYVNMLLTRSTGGGKQYFAFANSAIRQLSHNVRMWTITLYHYQGDDPMYYSADSYLSCPTFHYADSLRQGIDSVEIIIPTYDGLYRRSFLY